MLWSHVLSVGQLENLLLTVNNLESSVRKPFPDIPSVEPAISIQHVGGSLRVSGTRYQVSTHIHMVLYLSPEVPPEHISPHDADFPLALRRQVLHVRNIF